MVSVKVKAADNTVKIFIGDSKTPRHHRAVELGTETEELSFSLKGEKVKSSSYASNNPTSFKIKNTTEGKCIVEGVAEGTGLVTLTVKTEEGNTYKEKLFISVYTRIGSYHGVANKNTDVYRGATDNAGVENKDDKGDIKKSTEFSVTASCGDFYIIKTLDGTVYDDKQDTGFVKKADIDVEAEEIEVEDSIELNIGQRKNIQAKVLPEIARNKKLYYISNDERVVTIDKNGNLTAHKVGVVEITIYNENEEISEICEIFVEAENQVEWNEETEPDQDKILSLNIGKSNKKIKGFKISAKGVSDKKIKIAWNKQKRAKSYVVMRAKSKSKKYKKIATVKSNKIQYTDRKIKFYKKYKYKVICKKKNKKKIVSNIVTARSKDSSVNLKLKAVSNNTKSIKLSWNKQKYAKNYIVLRKKGTGTYKEIKKLSPKKNSYTDKSVEYFQEYTYKIKLVKTNNRKAYSNAEKCKTQYIVDKEKNIKYFREKYPFVCTDISQDMNEYSVFGNFYSPIKYKFTGDALEIHLYIDFVTYDSNGKKYNASRTEGYGGETYIDLFKMGLFKWYETDIVNTSYEFQGINFAIKMKIHDKISGGYNIKQKFNEVKIAGEHIDNIGTLGRHWYYTGTGGIMDSTYTYMPSINIILEEGTYFGENIAQRKENYLYTSAHEIGHTLGLDDGYNDSGYDRFTDNDETGVFYEKRKQGIMYDNLMVQRGWAAKILPNDIEMALNAYAKTYGRPWQLLEAYKTCLDLKMKISDCISNKNDYYVEDKKKK